MPCGLQVLHLKLEPKQLTKRKLVITVASAGALSVVESNN
jgi:hypothetical protein